MIPSLLAAAVALSSSTATGEFQASCARIVGHRSAAVVAVDASSGRLIALIHPDLAARPSPPGSVFKLVTAAAALGPRKGLADATFDCRGWLRAPAAGGRPAVLRCWRPEGHGPRDLEGAIAASCNLYFVQLGIRTGFPALAQAAGRAGLVTTGVDPRDARIAIGEGAGWLMTPLQAAGLAAAIAADAPVRPPAWSTEALFRPRLGPPAATARLRAGMRLAALAGSARRATTSGLEIAGKTGTATYRDGSNRTHGWFIGYARAAVGARPKLPSAGTAPRTLALAVRLDDASGFGDAAGLAGRVFAAWRDAGRP